MEKIIHTVIELGLESPVKLLQITDVHLTAYADEDPPSQKELLSRRYGDFRRSGEYPPLDPEQYFREALDLADRMGALPILTGDIIDLHSAGNVALFRKIIAGRDVMFTPGGHEHQRICRRTMEEEGDYAEVMQK